MEILISFFLGAFLMTIGILSYIRISKDFKEGQGE